MASKFVQRMAQVAVLAAGVAMIAADSASATRPERRPATRARAARGFSLFAGQVWLNMEVNRVQCGIKFSGEICVSENNSSVIGGGMWPTGTPDQYIFNGGLQIAAIIPNWPTSAGGTRIDTVGAFFFDGRGDQAVGEGRTNVMSGLNADDVAGWPSPAYAQDTSLFHSSLIGRKTISQMDTWVRYWDGNTNFTTGRTHPMGLLVEQRGLAWNFPSGNEDILYFLFRFINITSGNAADYAGLANAGYSASDIADIVAIAQEFRTRIESVYNITMPAGGVPFTQMYSAFGQDPDVGSAGQNYSNANFPFALSMAYKSDFREPNWQFPPNIFGAPFAAAPGFTGTKFLRSPSGGITVWTNTTNGGPFPDRFGVQALWRLLSGNLIPADGTCSIALNQVAARRFCTAVQTPVDSRFYMSSGPSTLNPGQSQVIVVAIVHAAPLASMNCNPAHGACPGGAWSLAPFLSGNMVPGNPVDGTRLLNPPGPTQDTLRNIERAMGWLTHADANADNTIGQTEVTVVKRSLLDKALVAQAVFDGKFLLPFAPEAPNFFLVPGDNRVTVVWQASTTENVVAGGGDPFFQIASQQTVIDPTSGLPVANALYDPNFRQYDVEGYRIWRGRTTAQMEVIAQFDYAGTTFRDFTSSFLTATTGSQCAPEIGITASCPAGTFNTLPYPVGGPVNFNSIPLAGNVQQVPPGGRVALASGNVFNITVDTAVTGGGAGFPGLTDTGVPFIFEDNSVRNGFTYQYAVTAFDVNSVASGPSSLESPLITKSVTPRLPSGQEVPGAIGAQVMLGGDGSTLDPNAAEPTINATTGIFSGPMPPTNGIGLGFGAFLHEVLGTGALDVTLDSVIPGSALTSTRPTIYWFTALVGGSPVKFSAPFQYDTGGVGFDEPSHGGGVFRATAVSQSQSARFGGDSTFALFGQVTLDAPGTWALTMKGRGDANGHPAGPYNGQRWWAGAANENVNDPNGVACANPGPIGNGGFACALTDLSRNSGQITGVELYGIRSYHTVPTSSPMRDVEGITSTVMRAADYAWYWGATPGTVDSVVDVTHRVRVPFRDGIRASWGILNDSSFTNMVAGRSVDGSNAKLSWQDVHCIKPLPSYLAAACNVGGANPAANQAFLMNHAILSPVVFTSVANTAAAATNGNGFVIYLGGWFTMVRTATLPSSTVWRMRSYAGNVTGTPGSYGFTAGTIRPPNVPGLRVQLQYTGATLDPTVTAAADLDRIHTVPDPYYVTNQLEITANTKVLRFVSLPSQAIVRIYSTSGILVNVLTHNDPGAGGELVWNLRNRNNQFVASGVYFYHVETPDGRKKIGRFTVVNFAQ